MVITRVGTRFTSALARRAMRMFFGMHSTNFRTLAADVRTQAAKIAMVIRSACQRIHCCHANIGAVKVYQRTLSITFTNISSRTGLARMNCFFARLDTCLQVFLFHSIHYFSLCPGRAYLVIVEIRH